MADKKELFGMKQIQECCGRLGLASSEASVTKMIQLQGFPARKIEGRWISYTDLIEKWRLGLLEKDCNDRFGLNSKKRNIRK